MITHPSFPIFYQPRLSTIEKFWDSIFQSKYYLLLLKNHHFGFILHRNKYVKHHTYIIET